MCGLVRGKVLKRSPLDYVRVCRPNRSFVPTQIPPPCFRDGRGTNDLPDRHDSRHSVAPIHSDLRGIEKPKAANRGADLTLVFLLKLG